MKENLTFRVTPEMRARLDALQDRRRETGVELSLSALLNMLLDKALKIEEE